MSVECTLFDSRDCSENADWMWKHWDEEFEDEPKPEEEPREMLMERAWDFLMDEHHNLVWELKHGNPGTLILAGSLGLWWGRPSAYKMVDLESALDYMKDDYDLRISYEDGDICTYHYHHDGTNCLTLYEVKPFWDLDLTGLTPENVESIRDVYWSICNDGILDDADWEWLEKTLVSTAHYFKNYLSADALDDLKKRESEESEKQTIEFLVAEESSDDDIIMLSFDKNAIFEWSLRNQDGNVYYAQRFTVCDCDTYDCVFQMDKSHVWRFICFLDEFNKTHKKDRFTIYEEE